MSPLIPNFNPGVGRLVTDRFDFQHHVDGYDFRHNATAIDLSPHITISSISQTTVQDAIAALALIVTPPTVADATDTVKGIIKLHGDFGGTASIPKVIGLQGFPINTATPTLNQVLTWNGTSWIPENAVSAFTAGGDLVGTNTSQQVVQLTGDSPGGGGNVAILAQGLIFDSLLPECDINQANSAASTDGSPLVISGQTATTAGFHGGDILIAGGFASGSGLFGGITLLSGGANLLQAAHISVNQKILGLLGLVNNTNMPANTGDRVIYIKDAVTVPTSGSPIGGSILYSTGGLLHVKQADGNDFAIGSIPNPSNWGEIQPAPVFFQTSATKNSSVTYRSYVQTVGAGVSIAMSMQMPDNASTRADVIVVGKEVTTGESGQYNLSMGFVRNSGTTSSIGTLTVSDTRTTAGAGAWTVPTISTTGGGQIKIITGAHTGSTIHWTLITQLVIVED